jgi:hypothetical protein
MSDTQEIDNTLIIDNHLSVQIRLHSSIDQSYQNDTANEANDVVELAIMIGR